MVCYSLWGYGVIHMENLKTEKKNSKKIPSNKEEANGRADVLVKNGNGKQNGQHISIASSET
jgi:hypothetical protein